MPPRTWIAAALAAGLACLTSRTEEPPPPTGPPAAAADAPAAALLVWQLGQRARRPPEAVRGVYRNHAGKGWGASAQELGIKPGSAEFHALKRGDLRFGAPPASHGDDDQPGHGHGHGKGKHGR